MRRLHVVSMVGLVTAGMVVTLAASVPQESRRVHFTTHEGSWLSFDVSRDGRRIALDLLGQLWLLPIGGGVAQPITDAVRDSAEFIDPVFAPDGASVLAHGEFRGRLGVFRVALKDHAVRWIAPDTVTSNFGHLALHSPSWASEAHVLLTHANGSQAPTLVDRDLRTGEEREIPVRGVEEDGRDGATYAADGTAIFFNTLHAWDTRATFPVAGRIWRVPADGGAARPVTPPNLRARGAAPSPDGRRIAYFVLDSSSRAQVWLQNVGDSVGVRLTDDRDVTATRLRWLGSDTLMYVESGLLWRLDVRSRRRVEIPFSATIDFQRKVPSLRPVHFPSAGERVTARGTRGFAIAPYGRTLAAIALNRLWIASTDSGSTARELVSVPSGAQGPHWSPNGRHIVWFAGEFGAIDLFVTDTLTRVTRRLTALRGEALTPAWSPDGRMITFLHISPDSLGRLVRRIRAIPVSDSVASTVAGSIDLGPGGSPFDGTLQWSPRSDAVLVLGQVGDLRERPASIRFVDGSAARVVHGLPSDASSVQWLRGDTLVFLKALRMWRASFDVAAGMVGPATTISDEPAAYLESSMRGDLLYVSDDGFRVRLRMQERRHVGWPVKYTVPTPPSLVVHNVRVIDGTGTTASAPRDILIERGRITRLASSGTIMIPRGARVLDGGGRTVIPGLIDLHSHTLRPAQFRGLLYYGVTTVRNLGSDSPPSDALTTGDWPGPRMVAGYVKIETDWPFSSGSGAGIWPENDAHHLERAIRLIPGLGSALVKIHSNNGFAAQMRTVAAAHSFGTRVTGHCAYPLALVAAGIDSKEHLGWQCTMHDVGTWYDDLVQLYAKSGVPIVPTLALMLTSDRQKGKPAPLPVELTGLFGETERAMAERSMNFRSLTPGNTMDLGHMLDAARKLHRAGVVLGAGSDFERPDALQYELEALVEASLTPLEAIAAATSRAARIMGASADVGRIAPGLLADIVILDADPTHDIRNTRRIWGVVQGAVVIDRQQLVAPAGFAR